MIKYFKPIKKSARDSKNYHREPIDIDDRITERCNGQLGNGKLKTECENMVDFTDEK